MADVNWGGVASVIAFYIVILLVGLGAGFYGKRQKQKREEDPNNEVTTQKEESMLAGRSIGWLVGSFTMTATWVGGGYINGTAEAVYDTGVGLIWAQGCWGYSVSLVVGGIFFARIMRRRRYVTFLDPFQEKFGPRIGGLLFIPAVLAEVMWCAAILDALGGTVSVILDFNKTYSVIGSAAIAIGYTLVGGLYSVAYTDIVQLTCIFFGLWLCVPFVLTHDHVKPLTETSDKWLGEVDWKYAPLWIDYAVQITFGGVPWQAYFQRVLSSSSENTAMILSLVAGVGCMVMSVPSILLGAAARSVTDWRELGYDAIHPSDKATSESSMILPLTLQYLTPTAVGWCGLGAVTAAVMSSTDSSVLSASTMFTTNVYQLVIRENAGEREVDIVLKCSIVVLGAAACAMALTVNSVFALWILCSDFVYVVLFPQLLCVIYLPVTNAYGSLAAYAVGLFFRCAGGIDAFDIPPLIKYPFYSDTDGQLFPMRTFSMLLSLLTLALVSFGTHLLSQKGVLGPRLDILGAFEKSQGETYAVKSREEYENERKQEELSVQKETELSQKDNGSFTFYPELGELKCQQVTPF